MADLSDRDASLTVKITGASSTGAETNFIDATVNGIKVDGSAVTQPVSVENFPATTATDGGTPPANAVVVGGVTAGGVFQTFETNASGHLNIADGGGSITVDAVSLPLPIGLQPSFSEFSISATGTTNYDTNISGYATLIATITGTWAGALEWYGSVNGITYVNLSAMNVLDFSGESQVFISANATVRLDISGFKFFRVRAVGVTGTASVVIGVAKAQSMLSQIQSSVFIANPSIPVTTSPYSSTASVPATATVTTTSSSVVPLNANRKGLIITNLTGTRVFLSFGANPAIVNRGIMLSNGGSFVMDSFTFTTAVVNAIVASGTTTLAIQEYV